MKKAVRVTRFVRSVCVLIFYGCFCRSVSHRLCSVFFFPPVHKHAVTTKSPRILHLSTRGQFPQPLSCTYLTIRCTCSTYYHKSTCVRSVFIPQPTNNNWSGWATPSSSRTIGGQHQVLLYCLLCVPADPRAAIAHSCFGSCHHQHVAYEVALFCANLQTSPPAIPH